MLAPAPTTPIATRYNRARTRKLEAAVGAMTEAGVAARWAGAEFELIGLDRVAGPDRALLEQLLPQIRDHLAEPGADDPEALLELLDIEVELVDDPDQARRVIGELPRVIAVDVETEPRDAPPPPELRITRSGRRYIDQPVADTSGAALDPFHGQPRLIQVFDRQREVVFIFDMHVLSYADLAGLFDRRVLIHSMFELVMLGAQGVEIPNIIDTLQLASLTLGCADGVRRLDNISKAILGIELPKALQTSYWSARNLSDAQLVYAAGDAAITHRAGRRMYQLLGERERQAFWVANAAVPVVANMRLRGLPFDPAVHRQTIAGWQTEFAQQREAFRQITGTEVPTKDNAVRDWLTARLPEAALANWMRTDTGRLSIAAAEIKRMALDWPEVQPLLAMRTAEKRISTFGQPLIDLVSPATGRLHGDYFLPLVTGRLSCRKPNLQNLPTDARRAVRAPAGKVLVVGDLNQIEMRVASELAGEEVMRAAFICGRDLHTVFAQMLVGEQYDQLPEEERAMWRKRAKAGNFGNLFGQGVVGFRNYAWAQFGLALTFDEAKRIRAGFYTTYPAIQPYQLAQYHEGRAGAVWSISGRPRRAMWEPDGELWFQACANYSIQASAADVLLDAMARVDRALPGALVASVHDELVLLADVDRTEPAAAVLEEQMIAAFVRWFPDAPTQGLVSVKIVTSWAEAK